MTIPVPPWWLRFLDGGNTRSAAVAGIAFTLGYFIGKGDRNHWKDVARSADHHWHKEYGWNDNFHGRHTDREHEREHERDSHRKHYER